MIRVWTDARPAGVLDRLNERGSTFAYDPQAPTSRAVSITMPVRVQSWDVAYGLPPIFEMNLPEGALRELLTRRFAKAQGRFDDFDLLALVGASQIGRIRYAGMDETITEDVPLQAIEPILRAKRDGGLLESLLEQFAQHSGLSGVQPKFMIRASGRPSEQAARRSPTIQSATHIVKFWDPEEYPELAANEYFCLSVAKRMGLAVPNFYLSDDGGALVIARFDYVDGRYRGFEDFCVLNALAAKDKYDGGYETRLFKRLRDYIPVSESQQAHVDLFRLFVLNCAVRNGDAHLKNFGLTYESVSSQASLAPVYDVITTSAYLPHDPMALTLDGSTRWPDSKKLARLGQQRIALSFNAVQEIFESAADAMSDVTKEMRKYFSESEFASVGERMIDSWKVGIDESLGLTKGLVTAKAAAPKKKRTIARSDSLILEALRETGGEIIGTHRAIAERIGIPVSTAGASIRRLAERRMIIAEPRKIMLREREV